MHSGNIDILTIGGFDPSNGAGITADVKTFEALNKPALSVQTCMTVQNESEIRKIYWFTYEQIIEQIEVLLELHRPRFVKLSLTENLESAWNIVEFLKEKLPGVKIIWDPVMRSSSGFDFYDHVDKSFLMKILKGVYLATPNWEEIGKWRDGDPIETAARYSSLVYICLKGGHRPDKPGVDTLFKDGRTVHSFPPVRRSLYSKHGSGCVFGSALTAYLSGGADINNAIRRAKDYIEAFLDSDPGLLGRHVASASDSWDNDKLYYLTQDLDHLSHRQQAQIAVSSGIRFIQIRSKTLKPEALAVVVSEIVEDASGSDSKIIVNDHVEIALYNGADGVHLGSSDMSVSDARAILGKDKIIGGTANTLEDLKRLVLESADYVGLGPYRFTKTKNNLSPVLGIVGVQDIATAMDKQGIQVPVYVIGGIGLDDVSSILETGIYGVAISSAINLAEDPEAAMASLQNACNRVDKSELTSVL
ncbi:MAG: thiamine phosphate synthase [Bacteroidetes bacterium]|nr:thiamine phosphate synthase [Bacteroidota bacterium]